MGVAAGLLARDPVALRGRRRPVRTYRITGTNWLVHQLLEVVWLRLASMLVTSRNTSGIWMPIYLQGQVDLDLTLLLELTDLFLWFLTVLGLLLPRLVGRSALPDLLMCLRLWRLHIAASQNRV